MISYVDQNREGIDPNTKLWEVVSGGNDFMIVGDTEIPSRAYVASFGFKGSDQQKPAGVLSGGERNRLNLALTLKPVSYTHLDVYKRQVDGRVPIRSMRLFGHA